MKCGNSILHPQETGFSIYRQYELLSLNAEERLEAFREQYGKILPRLSQQDIANYLGITPVSLSRLKSKALKKKS